MIGACGYYRLDDDKENIFRICQALGFSVFLEKDFAQQVCQQNDPCAYKPKKKEAPYR